MQLSPTQIDAIVRIAQSFGATRLILFGSTLDEPASARDVDLACDGVEGWDLYRLGAQLEEELRAPLDLVPLHPRSRLTELIERRGVRLL